MGKHPIGRQNISYCVELLRQISPSSVLDVGVGFGRWGACYAEAKKHFKDYINRDFLTYLFSSK